MPKFDGILYQFSSVELLEEEDDKPGHIEGNVEHPEEGGEVEVVHDDGQGKAGLPLHIHRQHVRQEAAVRAC